MPKILFIEDDPMIAEIYERKFSASGFETETAATGKEALKKARENKFDVVLLDIVLPEMDGLDVLRELKNGKHEPNMKVLIFSNLTDKETQDKALERGADGFIAKSQFSPSQLVGEVRRIIGQYSEEARNEIKTNDSDSFSNSGASSGGKRILFIEDEDIFIDMFGKKLESEGYNLTYAKNGAWGLKKALEESFDLIVLDIIMPAMTGPEIIERLKMEEKTKNIPVIALSASLHLDELEKVKEMGIKDYFVKTHIVPSDLAKKVKEILEK